MLVSASVWRVASWLTAVEVRVWRRVAQEGSSRVRVVKNTRSFFTAGVFMGFIFRMMDFKLCCIT